MNLSLIKSKIQSVLKDTLLGAAVIVGMGVIMATVGSIVQYILERFYHVDFGMPMPIILRKLWAPPLWVLFLRFLMVGYAEEGVFRNLLQDSLFTKILRLPSVISLGLASALFGAAHLWNGWGIPYSLPQACGAAFGGVLLGVVYMKKGLRFTALCHGLYDFIITVIMIYGLLG